MSPLSSQERAGGEVRKGATMTIRGKAYIVGSYEHPDRRIPDKSVSQIHAEVCIGALKDAGLSACPTSTACSTPAS